MRTGGPDSPFPPAPPENHPLVVPPGRLGWFARFVGIAPEPSRLSQIKRIVLDFPLEFKQRADGVAREGGDELTALVQVPCATGSAPSRTLTNGTNQPRACPVAPSRGQSHPVRTLRLKFSMLSLAQTEMSSRHPWTDTASFGLPVGY